MKRKEQILIVSLEMFNTEGEANLSAVDIAFEMDISPGNLYYHYRGKEEIVAALFDRFENTLKTLLQEALATEGSLKDFVVMYYALLEQIYDYRFFYRNLNDLTEKYPGIAKRFKKLMQLKQAFCEANLLLMLKTGLLDSDRVNLVGLSTIAENMVMMLSYFYEYFTITQETPGKAQFIKSGFKKISSLITPFANNDLALSVDYAEQIAAQFDYLGKD